MLVSLSRTLSLAAVTLVATVTAGAVTLTIDTGTTYQTIRGWGCVNSLPNFINPDYRDDMIYEIVNEFGLNRLRFEIPAGARMGERRWEWENDNADPMVTDWTKLSLDGLDAGRVDEFVGPFAAYVRANGEPFDFYISPSFYDGGSSGEAPAWLLDNPGENAEFAMSLLMRLKYVHGLEADYYCILNEANYNNAWNMSIVADKIKTLGPRMQAAGLKTKIEFPESVAVDTAMNYIDQTANDAEMWSWVGVVSYHRYGALTRLGELAAFAESRGLPTAFTEHSHTTLDRLHQDLTVGNVSYWEVYGLGSEIDIFDTPSAYLQYTRKTYYWRYRQVFKYVRPGAVRVQVTSDGGGTNLLAWIKDGRTIVNFGGLAGSLDLEGLTPGSYGLSSTRTTAAYVEHGLRTVGPDGKLSLSGLDSARYYTLYPYAGENLPPSFTNFIGSTAYLISPAASLTLTAAAQDPELNPISFSWAVTDAPSGANVSLATPNAANCVASGLTEPGVYTFTVTASDGQASTQRRVRCEVFAGNPAPVLFDVHNRIPVKVTLPDTATVLRSAVWDLNGDSISYQWSVVSQPAGANAQLATPTTQNTNVSGMTVAGDYVFRMTVSDGTTEVFQDHTVPVYPLNAQPSLSVGASPTSITLPTAAVMLTSVSSDADGDELTHWWRTKSAPAGARPVFATPGQANTSVSGLIVPGSYTFEHIVADESKRRTATVTVTVNAGGSPGLVYVISPNGGETLEPGQTYQIRWSTYNVSGDVKLEYFNGSVWSEIAASTANDGIEPWTVPTTPSNNNLIRVSSVSNSALSDVSDGGMRIRGVTDFAVQEVSGDFVTGPVLTWSSLPGGYAYQVYYSDTLMPGDWHAVGPIHTAGAGDLDLTYQDTSAIGQVRRFYQVEQTLLQ